MSSGHIIAEWLLLSWIAHPNTRDVSRCVANEPNVSVVIDGASLPGDWNAERHRRGSSSSSDHAAHQRHHRQRHVLVHHLVSSSFPLFKCRAVSVEHLSDQMWLHPKALFWERRIRPHPFIERTGKRAVG